MKRLLHLSLILVKNAKSFAYKSQLLMYTLINKTIFQLMAFSVLICCFASTQLKAQKYTDKDLIGTWETIIKKGGLDCKMTYILNSKNTFTSIDCDDIKLIDHFRSEWKYNSDTQILHQITDEQDHEGQIKWIDQDNMIYISAENSYNVEKVIYYNRVKQKVEALKSVKNPETGNTITYKYFFVQTEKYPYGEIDKFNISSQLSQTLKEKGYKEISTLKDLPEDAKKNICSILFVYPHHNWNIGEVDYLVIKINNCEGETVFSGDAYAPALALTDEAEARKMVKKISKQFNEIPTSMKSMYLIDSLIKVKFSAESTVLNATVATFEHPACNSCSATGKVKCSNCSGLGRKNCDNCYGKGTKLELVKRTVKSYDIYLKVDVYKEEYVSEDVQCSICKGAGKKTCYKCNDTGKADCNRCLGMGKDLYINTKKIIQD